MKNMNFPRAGELAQKGGTAVAILRGDLGGPWPP